MCRLEMSTGNRQRDVFTSTTVLRRSLRVIAVVLALVQCWAGRHSMGPDGVSYLDVGDAYFRGDWTHLNAYWSPLYSWLLGLANFVLKPVPRWEFFVAHCVNFVIFLGLVGCFEFFLNQIVRYNSLSARSVSRKRLSFLPAWFLWCFGYAVFLVVSLQWITVSTVSPDLLTACFFCLSAGIVVRMRCGATGSRMWFFFGIALGFGYLAKAVMFPLAFSFLLTAFLAVRPTHNGSSAIKGTALALASFLLVGGPYVAAISSQKGAFTYGESGRLNYAFWVNKSISVFPTLPKEGGDTPSERTVQRVSEVFPVYSYGQATGGTYPPHFDPPFWLQGVTPHFDLSEQIGVLAANAKTYIALFLRDFWVVPLCWLVFSLSVGGLPGAVQGPASRWWLLLPVLAGLGVYLLVVVIPRYVGAFTLLLVIGLFSGLRIPCRPGPKRRWLWCLVPALLVLAADITVDSARTIHAGARDMLSGGMGPTRNSHWEAAEALYTMGLKSGDGVGVIGDPYEAYWARLGRFQIVAEVSVTDAESFWASDDAVKEQVYQAFRDSGARGIITDMNPSKGGDDRAWERLDGTGYFVHTL
jgi:hypothetical protein